ncbi:Ig-like domain repeat protein, partial [Candidatus Desantisbacteria bacterium]|nr:Ig-like domain repeat protein [Candidatus Desantisbacteria bacterium]
HVKAMDSAGNWSNASHYRIQVDTQPPDIPVIFSSSHPDQNKWYATNTPPSLTWTASWDNASGLAGYSYQLDQGSSTIPNDSIEGTNTAYIHNVPLADGTYYFHIKAMDSAGNWSNASHYRIMIDTKSPVGTSFISSSSHPDQSKWYAVNTPPSLTWTIFSDDASGLAGYSYQLDQDSGTILNGTITGTNTAYTHNVPLTDGIYYFHVKAGDSAGNWSNTNNYKIQVDITPPDVPVISSISHPDSSKWYAANILSITWTAQDNLSGLAGYNYQLDQDPSTPIDDTIKGTNTAYTHGVPLTNGIYYFHVKAMDYAGNWSNTSHYRIQVDTQSPDIPVISSSSHPDSSKWYAADTPSLTWTAQDNLSGLAGYSYQLDQDTSTIPDNSIDGINTAYTHGVSLTNGIYYFHIKAKDFAGNWSNASHYKIQVDIQPPATPVISSSSHPDSNKWYPADIPSLTWTASQDNVSGLAGYSYQLDQDSSTIPDNSIDGTNTAYTHNTPLADGIHYFHVKAGDSAGNWSNASHYRIQVDTQPPDIPVIFSSSHPDGMLLILSHHFHGLYLWTMSLVLQDIVI